MQWPLTRYTRGSQTMRKLGHRKWTPVPGPCRCGSVLWSAVGQSWGGWTQPCLQPSL